MRNGIRRKLRADLARVRQDVLIKLEEAEERLSPASRNIPEEKPSPALLETIAQRMLDELGGGEFRIMLKGEQMCKERARELRIEEEKRLWAIPLYRNQQ
jgi:hypothetical protein